jgi:hypothetical protein
MKRNKTYIILIILFVIFGSYFTSWFTIAVENRSGTTIESLEIENRFVHKKFVSVPNDTVIRIKAFIPFDRKVQVRSLTEASIQNYIFTAENAYAGTKYNTVLIQDGISRVSP